MRDWIELGPTPMGEECTQVGTDAYPEQSLAECRRYRELLERKFPKATFGIKTFPHDFGSYREVVVYFDDDVEGSLSTALNVERNLPENWED